ncbi:MAG: hypothetical protein HOL80_02640 [Candidatus Magasanikbacteria bacterium]|jgi:hypothetical protein|nr:hypothetical protein [Candidatus Magasanikbacteria bacterium]MBT5819843.1 hypothetical protein [Candidatus Magasanikbacteria bacterium]MBT6294749.1 hypothetical protein [Candidatus Magasanikbacteria bacterium]
MDSTPHFSIQTQQDIERARQHVVKLSNSFSDTGYELGRFLTQLISDSPQYLDHILGLLEVVRTTASIDELIQYLAEGTFDRTIIFNRLPLFGKINTWSSGRVYGHLFSMYPGKEFDVFRQYNLHNFDTLSKDPSILNFLAERITYDRLQEFVTYAESFFRPSTFSHGFLQALFINPHIHAGEMLRHTNNRLFYLGAINYVDWLFDQIVHANPPVSPVEVMDAVVDNTFFKTLDKNHYNSIVREIMRRVRQGDFSKTLQKILLYVDGQFMLDLPDAFLEYCSTMAMESETAKVVYQKIVSRGDYNMHNILFLTKVVSSTDKQIMQRAIYRDILTLFPAEYKRGVFLRELARINAFGFAQLFLKKQKFFKRVLPKYSGEFKEVYKMCWSQVGLFDKFKALFR